MLVMAGIATGLCAGSLNVLGQQNQDQNQGNRGQQGGRGQGQGQGRGNFDPAQFRERMMERYKEQLEITDEAEWKAIQPLVEKVQEARMNTMGGMFRGFMGGRRGGPDAGGPGGGRPPGVSNPESDVLQKAIDGKASNAELKAALAKYAEARKAKQAELEKAQDNLRKVLSVRQEALATLNGIL
jgi:hypothetical protein